MGRRAQQARRGGSRRTLRAVGLLAVVALALTLVVPALAGRSRGALGAPEAEASDAAASIVSKINAARAANGLGSLAVAGDLTSAAAERAAIMARDGALSHTPDLGSKVCCWTWIGENVGYAYSAQQAHDMFMASAPHRANILESRATDVGVAVVTKDGTLWVAEVFRARIGSDSGSGSGSGSGTSTSGSRSLDASQASRSGTRTPPATDGASSATVISPRPQHSATWVLSQRLQQLRKDLRQRVAIHGEFDPLRAAMRYAKTLDRVNR